MLESTQSVRMTAEQKESETSKLIAAADTNRDGVLDWDEFKDWFIPTARTIQAHQHRVEQIKKQRRAQKAGRTAMTKPRDGRGKATAVDGREQPTPQIT